MAAGGGCGPGGPAAAAAGAEALKTLQFDEELARAALSVDWRLGRIEVTSKLLQMQAFRDAESSILRGLDIRSLQAVVNLDFPDNLEDYVHRIGRTGRAGEIGDAYTFFTPQDKHHALQGLVEILEEAKQPVDPFLRKEADEGHTAKRFFRNSKPQGGGGGDWGGGGGGGDWSGWKEGDWQQGQGDWKEEGGAPAASGSPKHTSPKAASPKAEAAAASWTSQPQYGGALHQPQCAGLLARERPHVPDHERISCAFAEIDEGNKGFVTLDELERGFRARGIDFTISTVQELFAKGDANQDQRLDRHEWQQFARIYPNTVDAVYYRGRDLSTEQALRDSVAALQRDLELGRQKESELRATADAQAQQNQDIARQLQEQEQQLRNANERRDLLEQEECEVIEQEIKPETPSIQSSCPSPSPTTSWVRQQVELATGERDAAPGACVEEAEISIDGDEIVQESSGKGRV